MIVILGATGYMGQAYVLEMTRRQIPFRALSRSDLDYSRFHLLRDALRELKAEFLINAAGFTGKPNVDACETARAESIQGNVLLPQTIAQACESVGIPWGHVSSGCIYAGAHVQRNGVWSVEKDLMTPELRELRVKTPSAFRGFSEMDAPNFSFRQPPCSFYSGTKALGEEAIEGIGNSYIWRLRMPFDHLDGPRNLLTKLNRYSRVIDNVNSLSHRHDFVQACLDLAKLRAPYGIYNITNPGWLTNKQIAVAVAHKLNPKKELEFFANENEFMQSGAKAPRSNCLLSSEKLRLAGIELRDVREAFETSLNEWQPSTG